MTSEELCVDDAKPYGRSLRENHVEAATASCCYRDAVTILADARLHLGLTSKRPNPGGVVNALPRIPSCRVQKKDH